MIASTSSKPEGKTAKQWYKRGFIPRKGVHGTFSRWRTPTGKSVEYEFFTEKQVKRMPKSLDLARRKKLWEYKDKLRKINYYLSLREKWFGSHNYIYDNEISPYDFPSLDIVKYVNVNDICYYQHTSWQLLNWYHRIPMPGVKPMADDSGWYRYNGFYTWKVPDVLFNRLQELYIKKYGGWETIDLDNTSYNGSIWWTNDDIFDYLNDIPAPELPDFPPCPERVYRPRRYIRKKKIHQSK